MLSYYTKYLKLISKCSQCRSKAFQNEKKIEIEILLHLGNLSNFPNLAAKLGTKLTEKLNLLEKLY